MFNSKMSSNNNVRQQLMFLPITFRRNRHGGGGGSIVGGFGEIAGGGSEHSSLVNGGFVDALSTQLATMNVGGDGELICDECHCTKRHADMTWWWDEQCAITICEHCCMSNHRQHRLKPQDEAERDEMTAYEKFLRDHQSATDRILTDIVEQRQMLQTVGANLGDVRGLGDVVKTFIGKYEKKLKHIEKEIFTVKDMRLTSGTYWKRSSIRDEAKQIFGEVDGAMTDLMPRLDKLVKQFDQVKLSLGRWDREGMTATGGDEKCGDTAPKVGF